MFTEAFTYFITAFFAVTSLGVALAALGIALMVRERRAPLADVTVLRPATAAGQEAA